MKREWMKGKDVLLYHPKYGSVKHEQLSSHDQYTIEENPGVIIVPYRDNKIGLVEHYREVPDKIYFEAPRGFIEKGETCLDAAVREIEEEIGINVRIAEHVGKINPNTSFYETEIDVVKIKLPDSYKVKLEKGIESFNLYDLNNLPTIEDGLTGTAILQYMQSLM